MLGGLDLDVRVKVEGGETCEMHSGSGSKLC